MVLSQHVLSALLPGCGHFLLRRPVRGIIFTFIFFCCFEGVLVYVLLSDPAAGDALLRRVVNSGLVRSDAGRTMMADAFLRTSLVAGIFVWLLAHADLIWIRRILAAATDDVFLSGVKAYLHGDLDGSEKIMRRMVHADPHDVYSRMYLSMIYEEKGRLGAARRELRRCRSFDTEKVLDWETKTDLQRLKSRSSAAS